MSSILHFFRQALVPALSLWLLATPSHSTPVFEPVQGFVRSPENPQAKLIQASDGDFYGTTANGGTSGYGAVFKMTATGMLTTLVNFTSDNGRKPQASLVQGSDGNFYGTTREGGSSYGTVFKMTAAGELTTLVNFNDSIGFYPQAALVQGSDGNFYGTTYQGGSSFLYGTVFKMTSSGTLTTLVNFTSTNGSNPTADLVQGSDGNFYGTTYSGGSSGYGTVFMMTATGTLTTLVNFTNTNGNGPKAGLVQGSDGNFYGTTSGGGSSGYGTVFKMTPTGTLTTLRNFTTSTNGRTPYADLVQGSDGNFYGTTSVGGSSGYGTVFKMTPTGTLTTLVNFTSSTNGSFPNAAGLVQGSDGNFYGTTISGGTVSYGTVFKMTPTGTLTTLVNFTSTNGRNPYAGLVQGGDGNFYGTTYQGGSSDYGTVFKMTASGTLTTLVNFTSTNGSYPRAGLVQGNDGNFYGTTGEGGSSGYGTVFKMTATGTLTTLVNFTSTNGRNPYAGLVQGSDGNFYGTTFSGGSSGYGTVFNITATGTLTTLVNFTATNGSYPLAGLVQGGDGNFYGTTFNGGTGSYGTVFKMTSTGTLTTLVNFTSINGGYPNAGLVQGSDGNFYGTTEQGGSSGYGTVFKMTPTGTLTTLVNFTSTTGRNPRAGLVQASDGNFYGTTYQGGSSDYGTVFKMTASGALTTLVNFTFTNGRYTNADLVQGSDGNLYGTTNGGGRTSDDQPAGGGMIFRLRFSLTVTSQPQTYVTSTSATLNGTVNPGGYSTPVSFQYGTDPMLATFSTASAGILPVGTTDTTVQASVSGLQPSTLYYYRLLASNVEYTVPQYGSILSFTTANMPQTITFAVLSDRVPTSPAFSLSASASSSLPVSFALVSGPATLLGSTVTLTGAPGTVIIRASQAGNGSYSAAPPIDRSFTVAASTVLLTNWTTSAGLSGANAAPDATPFNDGVENLLKYAFNMNAAGPDVRALATGGNSGLPQIAVDSSGAEPMLKVAFLRRKGSGLIYTPQRSTTLGDFVAMTGTPVVTAIDAQWERVSVEEPAPPATAPRAFARVQVSLP